MPAFLAGLLARRPVRKGRWHKYLRKIPTGRTSKTGKPLYRYLYRVGTAGGMGHAGEIKVGAAFAVVDQGERGHFHVTEDHGDGTVTIKHDETGAMGRIGRAELSRLVREEHVEALAQAHSKAQERHDEAQAHGSPKQRARAKRDLDAARAPSLSLAGILLARDSRPRRGVFLKIENPALDARVRNSLVRLEMLLGQDASLARILPRGVGRLTIVQDEKNLALRDAVATYSLVLPFALYLNPHDPNAPAPRPQISFSDAGRGTLAHEWAHFLDNALGIVAAANRGVPRGKWAQTYLTTTHFSEMVGALDDEVLHAWVKLTDAIFGRREVLLRAFPGAADDPQIKEAVSRHNESDFYLRAMFAEGEDPKHPYLSRKQEVLARSFEAYVDRYRSGGRRDADLADTFKNAKMWGTERYTQYYPSDQEAPIHKEAWHNFLRALRASQRLEKALAALFGGGLAAARGAG
jgi:hypothetical protein